MLLTYSGAIPYGLKLFNWEHGLLFMIKNLHYRGFQMISL